MARSSHPIITAQQILSIKPGESIIIENVDEKRRSIISTMLGYIKDTKCPRGIADYACMCRNGRCKIIAIPKGVDKKTYKKEHNDY